MDVQILPCEQHHVQELLAGLRPENARELGLDQKGQAAAILETVQTADRLWVGLADNRVVCIFGIYLHSLVGRAGYLFLFVTNVGDQVARTFAKYSKIVVQNMLGHYRALEGHVNCDYARCIAYLEWLGFTVDKTAVIDGRYHFYSAGRPYENCANNGG